MLCLVIACTFLQPIHAQIEKGKWIGGITLDGKRYKVDAYTNDNGIRVYGGDYIESNFASSIFINKMVSKKWLIGIGISHNRSFLSTYKLPPNSPASSYQDISKTFGLFSQVGYFTEISKNIYLSHILQLGYNKLLLVNKSNYNYPNEIKQERDGYEIAANILPLQVSYLYKKHFLFSLNLVSFNYNRSIRYVNLPQESFITQFTYSLNPFKNGFTFSYIF
jgi:hypothetical protein